MSGKRRIPWPIFSGAARSAGNLRASAQLDEPRRRLRREQRRRGETKRSSLPRPRRRSAVHLRPSAAFLDNFPPGSVTYSSDNEIRDFRQLHLRRGRTQISRAFRATCLSRDFGKRCAKLLPEAMRDPQFVNCEDHVRSFTCRPSVVVKFPKCAYPEGMLRYHST